MTAEPDFRAAIDRDTVRLVAWHPGLPALSPAASILRTRHKARTAVVDLTLLGYEDDDDEWIAVEVIVSPLAGKTEAAAEALGTWAAAIGLTRIWLPDDVRELEPTTGGAVSTRCPACRMVWTEDDAEFWLAVRRSGCFPIWCRFCGGDVPQWKPVGPVVAQGRLSSAWRDDRPIRINRS